MPPFAIQQANSLSVESVFAALSLHAQVWQVVCVCVCDCVRVIILLAGGSWTKPSTCGTATSSETLPRICQRLHRHAVSDMFLCSSLLMNSSTTHTHARTHRGYTPSTTIHPGERCQSATQSNSHMHSLLPSVTLNPLVPSV